MSFSMVIFLLVKTLNGDANDTNNDANIGANEDSYADRTARNLPNEEYASPEELSDSDVYAQRQYHQ